MTKKKKYANNIGESEGLILVRHKSNKTSKDRLKKMLAKNNAAGGLTVKRPPCAGTFLNGLYGLMAKDVQESKEVSEDWKNGAFNAMNQTLVVLSNWCGCSDCKARARRILELVQKKKEDKD